MRSEPNVHHAQALSRNSSSSSAGGCFLPCGPRLGMRLHTAHSLCVLLHWSESLFLCKTCMQPLYPAGLMIKFMIHAAAKLHQKHSQCLLCRYTSAACTHQTCPSSMYATILTGRTRWSARLPSWPLSSCSVQPAASRWLCSSLAASRNSAAGQTRGFVPEACSRPLCCTECSSSSTVQISQLRC